MAAPFAPGTDERNDIQDDYNDKFNRADELKQLRALEEVKGRRPDATPTRQGLDDESDDIRSKEENPAPWADETGPQDAPKQSGGRIRGFFRENKNKGPLGFIVTALIGGVIGVSFLTPGLLLLHVSETITDKMNMQFPSLEKRTDKILARKLIDQSTSGVCAGGVTIRCKYNTLNDRQLKNFRQAGFTVNLKEDTTLTGRHKPINLEFKGKTIDAADLEMLLREDPELRSAFKRAYNPKFASFSDKVFASAARLLGFDKTRPFPVGATDEQRTKTVKEKTKHATSVSEEGGRRYKQNDKGEWVYEDDPNTLVKDADGNPITTEAANTNNNAIDGRGIIKNGIEEIGTSEEKLTGKALAAAEETIKSGKAIDAKSLAGGILGGVAAATDTTCSFYGMYRAVSFGAKTIRSAQMARYAMMFLTTASMIKAGDATPEDVSYLATLLTKTVSESVTDAAGKTTQVITKAATDSYGYRYVAYGDIGPLTRSAAEFTAGGGLGGDMTGIAKSLLNAPKLLEQGVGGQKNIKNLCGFIKSPWGQAANVVLSIGLLVFGGPIGWGALASSAAVGAVASIALSTAQTILTPILADMVAGVLVDSTTFGEKTGDALVSGSGVIMSTSARLGGNAPLRPAEAVAYTNMQQEVLAQYAEEERLARSPLDPTSPYTFMGRIVNQLIPYSTQTGNISSIATTSLSVAKRSLATIFTPSAFAAENTVESFQQCDDMDYQELGLATDPFCNPIYGMPAGLDLDPDEVASYLISTGDIDDNGTVISDRYKKFIANCTNRDRPLGDSGDEFNLDTGSQCFVENDDESGISKEDKTYFYIFQIDQRVLDGMENGYAMGGPSCGPSGSSSSSETKMSQNQLKEKMTFYGLPEPKEDGLGGYNELLDQLKNNPDAGWAAQQLLSGEKKWKKTGSPIEEYLTTAWVWLETGPWPDPYEMNCNDAEYGTKVSDYCGGGLIQVAGFQGFDRKNDYVNVFKKLYSEDQLGTVLSNVIKNSDKTIDGWSYINPAQKEIISKYVNVDDFSSVTLADISPNKDIFDQKTQILTFILGKDPAMAAALNSFEVKEGDVVTMLQDCTKLGWSNTAYYCSADLRQKVANIMMALYLYDGAGPSGDAINCDDGGGAKAPNDRDNDSLGIQSIVKGSTISMVYEMKDGGEDCGLYEYALQYGLDSCIHTGTDILVPPEAPLYTPVSGTVTCAGTGIGPGTKGGGCAAFADVYGQGNGRIEIEMESGDVLILGHSSTSTVTAGQKVKAGQQVGTNGGMNSWHVHVEYRIPDSSTPSGWRIIYPESGLGGKAIPNGGIGPTPS